MRLPDSSFYLFGMGHRPKLLYRRGALVDALTGRPVRSWQVASEHLSPSEYRVDLRAVDGSHIAVWEDEQGLWVQERDRVDCLDGSQVNLPDFAGHPHAALLRVLHQEILVNIVGHRPLPNLFVYRTPWYRDAAMVCMCLEHTANLGLVADWVLGLREPFDRNNAGNCETDNLGQALYMISLVSDSSHPLVPLLLRAAGDARRERHVVGLTDGQEHPVYQTKWLKLALNRLGLDDPYLIPEVYDSYSALFWMNYQEAHVEGPRFRQRAKDLYPYLAWAEAHFHREPPPMAFAGEGYPLTYESHASEADYDGMGRVAEEYVARKIAAPHSWHAAEMFLYLLELGRHT